jgi:hypothetical protein
MMNVKGNEKILRRIFDVLIRIERFLKKNETKEEPKEK